MRNLKLIVLSAAAIFAGITCQAENKAAKKGSMPAGLREELAQNYTTVGYTQTAGHLKAEDINGEWQLATIDSKNVTEEDDVPYIFFESQRGRF